MATSGSVDFSVTRDQMINASYRKLGIAVDGETLTSEMVTNASQALNFMLKAWQADGLKLWLRKKATVFLAKDDSEYSLGPTGDHATYSYTRVQILTAATSGATSIDVTTTGMTAGDYIGIVQDDGTLHWTTVASITDSDTVVITTAITDDCAVDNYVYFYTTKIARPLRVLQAFIRDSSNNDTPLSLISQKEYFDLPNKTTDGRVVSVSYDPQLTNGTLYVWPQTSSVTDTIELIVQRPIEDMDSTNNDFDCSSEWYEAIVYGLALRLTTEYSVPREKRKEVKEDADSAYAYATSFDVENTSLFFQPDTR